MRIIIRSFFIFIFLFFSVSGCGNPVNYPGNANNGSVRITIKWPHSLQAKTILPETQSIKVSLTDYTGTRNTIQEITINAPETSVVFQEIPAGRFIYVQARAYSGFNCTGGIISFGESDLIEIIPNETNDVAIFLKRNVYFDLRLKYNSDSQNYQISTCLLRKFCYEPDYDTFFINAIIKVAGYVFPSLGNGSLFWHSPISLNPGDKITVEISHPAIGDYTTTLIVPEPLPGITTEPNDLNQWFNDSSQDPIIRWQPVNCDRYCVSLNLYDETKTIGIYELHRFTTDTTINLHPNEFGFSSQTASLVDISVTAIGYTQIPDFYFSSIMIYSQTLAKKTKLP